MKVILLERIAKLGQMGDIVDVKNGYGRNFLLPQGKALRATEANKKYFEDQKVQLEARNLERRQEAEKVAAQLEGKKFIVIRSAGETGQLYGSVAARDIVGVVDEQGIKIERSQIRLDKPIKIIGLYQIVIQLHGEVEKTITINVARSEDEADRQYSGEDLTQKNYHEDEAESDVQENEDDNAEESSEEEASSEE